MFLLLILVSTAAAQDAPITIHVVQRGETLFRIAQQYGLSISELARVNSLSNPNSIEVGQRLLIPLGAVTLPETHVVQPGETLASISGLYGLAQADLIAINNIANANTLYVGQVLALSAPVGVPLVNAGANPAEPPVLAPPAQVPPAQAEAPPAAAQSLTIHIVTRGETLFRIAARYGTDVNTLVQANSLSAPDIIFAGQSLVIPLGSRVAPVLPSLVASLDVVPLVLSDGETGMFRLVTTESAALSGTFLDRPLNIASENNGTRHTALVGIPLDMAASVYPLTITVAAASGVQTVSLNVQIVTRDQSVDSLTLLPDRSDLLDPVLEDAEMNLMRQTMSAFNPTRSFNGPMGLPAAATITSPFGAVRSYNGGEVTRTHLGTDFAGVPGTPILAPAPGVVVLADTLNIRGNATVIDHGWGVYTGYWHQTEQYVSVGEVVGAGQVIGTIGSTGRVSGPHLHWEVWVNGIPVDAMQWVILNFS